jgi:hypothetical protein
MLDFRIPRAGRTALAVFDAQGRRVRDLWRAPLEAGTHRIVWDGSGTGGARVAAGVYFVVLESDQQRSSRAITIVR